MRWASLFFPVGDDLWRADEIAGAYPRRMTGKWMVERRGAAPQTLNQEERP